MLNPVVLIRNILDDLMLDYDDKSFDMTELYCYRNHNDSNIVLCGTQYDLIEQLLDTFGGFIVYNNGLLYIGTKGQTYCPIDEAIVEAKRCNQCPYYLDPWYNCNEYNVANNGRYL